MLSEVRKASSEENFLMQTCSSKHRKPANTFVNRSNLCESASQIQSNPSGITAGIGAVERGTEADTWSQFRNAFGLGFYMFRI